MGVATMQEQPQVVKEPYRFPWQRFFESEVEDARSGHQPWQTRSISLTIDHEVETARTEHGVTCETHPLPGQMEVSVSDCRRLVGLCIYEKQHFYVGSDIPDTSGEGLSEEVRSMKPGPRRADAGTSPVVVQVWLSRVEAVALARSLFVALPSERMAGEDGNMLLVPSP